MTDVNLQLTVAGEKLMAKINKGKGKLPLDITRIVTASGISPDPLNLTSVVDLQQEFTIINQTEVDKRTIIEVKLTNFGNPAEGIPSLNQGYQLSQIGFYANDPDEGEILFRISQFTNPNRVPALSERPFEFNLRFEFTIGNASKVIININPSDFATKESLENHNRDASSHPSFHHTFAPRYHASEETEFGLGAEEYFGHVALSDEITSDLGINDGTASTPLAVNNLRFNLQGQITDLRGRLSQIENSLFNAITANPFLITFGTLDGIAVERGVWNSGLHRMEC